jgi:hypothetical protein
VNIGGGVIEGDMGGSEERELASVIIGSPIGFVGELVLSFLRGKE